MKNENANKNCIKQIDFTMLFVHFSQFKRKLIKMNERDRILQRFIPFHFIKSSKIWKNLLYQDTKTLNDKVRRCSAKCL